MESIGRNADLRAHAELTAVGELGGGIVQHDGAVDPRQEAGGRGGIAGHDGFGVRRTVARDMRDGLIDTVDHAHRDDRIQILGVPVLFGRRAHPRIDLLHGGIAAHFAAGLQQILDQGPEVRRDTGAIHQQGLGGAADAGTPQLGIQHDAARHRQVRIPVHVHVAVALQMADHRHARLLLHSRHQALAAAGHEHIDEFGHPGQHQADRGTIGGRHQLDARLRAGRRRSAPPPGRHGWRDWSARSPSRRAG